MDIIKAVKHLGWRFSETSKTQNRMMKLNQNDINSLEQIAKSVELMQSQQFRANQSFAKLYIFIYMRFISKYQSTVLDPLPRKQLHKILERPVTQWMEDFKNEMNDSEMYSLLESVGIDLKHPALVSDSERIENTSKAKKVLKNVLNEVWDLETVTELLTIEINNALNKYETT